MPNVSIERDPDHVTTQREARELATELRSISQTTRDLQRALKDAREKYKDDPVRLMAIMVQQFETMDQMLPLVSLVAERSAEMYEQVKIRKDDNDLIDVREVMRTGKISASSIDRMVRDGTFPAPLYLSRRKRVWTKGSIRAWKASLPSSPKR